VSFSNVAVSVAQIAAGGTIAQMIRVVVNRRSELRQLDNRTDSVAVENAAHVIKLLRTELDANIAKTAKLEKDYAAERADMQRQITRLGEDVSRVRAENVVMKAEIGRLQRP
jgi:uncharacterized protein YgiM (DUF1202 family)